MKETAEQDGVVEVMKNGDGDTPYCVIQDGKRVKCYETMQEAEDHMHKMMHTGEEIKTKDRLYKEIEAFVNDSNVTAKKDIKVGDRVEVSGTPHSPETDGKQGTVKIVGSPALGIKFDGMDGIHKWYVASELKILDDDDEAKKKKMKMKM